MGRMRKQTADYFPHYVYKGRTLTFLESKWGCTGYTFWFKLLELLCISDGHCYDCSIPTNLNYLAIYALTDDGTAIEILNLLADMGKIDAPLWKEKQVIWCQSLVDRLSSLYAKRTTEVPKKPLLDGEEREEEQPQPEPEPTPPPPQEQPKQGSGKKGGKPRKKADPKPPEPKKVQYAEFVAMTEAEHQKLVEKYGEDFTAACIQKLDNAKGSKGYKYKNDYRAILSWVVERVREDLQKQGGYGRGIDKNFGNSQSGEFKPSGGFRGDES